MIVVFFVFSILKNNILRQKAIHNHTRLDQTWTHPDPCSGGSHHEVLCGETLSSSDLGLMELV